MSRKPVIAGNWKMNNGPAEAVVLTQEISNMFEKDYAEVVDTILIPPAIDIKSVKTVLEFDKRPIFVGAQNAYFKEKGAYTGEISIPMIAEAGCEFCIVGHSERRDIFGETNDLINDKMKALISFENGRIKPILCVGESLSVRESGEYKDFIEKQIKCALAGLDILSGDDMIVAYEPIWAIGTGRTATPDQAEEVCGFIRDVITDLTSEQVASDMRILYGGSVNEGNIDSLIEKPNIDGALVGGASLKASSFIELVRSAAKCR